MAIVELNRPPQILAIVLCGGRGRRFGTPTKPLADLHGKPLVADVIDRLKPQVDDIVLSCAQPNPAYEQLGYRIVLDTTPNEGPLGGIVSVLDVVASTCVLTAPADTPFLPHDLVATLTPACRQHGVAVAHAGGRQQNLVMLMDEARTISLARFFKTGGRAALRWLDDNAAAVVEFPAAGFLNVNTPADLAAARRRTTSTDANRLHRGSGSSTAPHELLG